MNYLNHIKKNGFKKHKKTVLIEIPHWSYMGKEYYTDDKPNIIYYNNRVSEQDNKFLEISLQKYKSSEYKYNKLSLIYPERYNWTDWKQYWYKLSNTDKIYLYVHKNYIQFIYLGYSDNKVTYSDFELSFEDFNSSKDFELILQNLLPPNVYREYLINKYL